MLHNKNKNLSILFQILFPVEPSICNIRLSDDKDTSKYRELGRAKGYLKI